MMCAPLNPPPARAAWRDRAFLLALCFGPAIVTLGVVAFFAIAIGGGIR